MNKQIFFIPGLFALGILVGIAMMKSRDIEQPTPVTGNEVAGDAGESEQASPVSWFGMGDSDGDIGNDVENVQSLEDKVAELEARILDLEQVIADQVDDASDAQPSRMDVSATRSNRLLTTRSLVKAGLSEEMAADIVRRRNEIEIKKLELRDRALREGYLGTARYMRELSQLVNSETPLREELGDTAYDQYLYANGQPNRVKVESVMLGSAAEQAGMKDGDIVVRYGESQMFEWNELKNATSEGELGEYVNIDVLRDGQVIGLWVPRGPLGVRLGSARVAP